MLSSFLECERWQEFTQARRSHWDNVALTSDAKNSSLFSAQRAYRTALIAIYTHLVSPNARILELGCGEGDLLAALQPAYGVGIDFSGHMINKACTKHPQLHFVEADIHTWDAQEKFDVIILSDVINDVWDAQRVLKQIKQNCHSETRIILNVWSRVWQMPLTLARALGFATPLLEQNWFSTPDILNLLALEDFIPIKQFAEILLPLQIPVLSTLCNRYIAKLPLFNLLCLSSFIVARLRMLPEWVSDTQKPLVSVVVPARNESGNIPDIIRRTPDMGRGTELIFVEGNSTDDTWACIQREVTQTVEKYPQKRMCMMQQSGKGKGDAVRKGFAAATGDIVMILDADMTVPPEDLPLFYEVLASGQCEFVNGVRLVYPMDKQAMRFCNLVANKGFSVIFSWLLGQTMKDTLCGTKAMSRTHYGQIAANRAYFGDFDPFGDYDLIFGAAKQNLHIRDLPVRYRDRTYGTTNISRWKHGVILLRMVLFAATRIKFI